MLGSLRALLMISWRVWPAQRTEDQQKSSKMVTECPKLEDEDGWINVKWNKGRKKKDGPAFFPAKVLMFGGKFASL